MDELEWTEVFWKRKNDVTIVENADLIMNIRNYEGGRE